MVQQICPITKSVNGIEVCVFNNTDSPFSLDLYMRQFMTDKRKTIKAFHAELTPELAEEIAIRLLSKVKEVRERQSSGRY